jgi:hypothetical protein
MAMSQGDGAGAGGGALTAISAAMAVEETRLAAMTSEKANVLITCPFFFRPRACTDRHQHNFLMRF